jgi:hypothetical protein
MNRKAIDIWVSWILLMALTITLGAFMYSWITQTAETTTESFQLVYDRTECENIAISIEACNQTQTLYINVSNKQLLTVDGLIFRVHYSDSTINTTDVRVKLEPGQKKDYTVGFNSTKTLAGLEAVPFIQTGDLRIVCSSRLARLDSINSC